MDTQKNILIGGITGGIGSSVAKLLSSQGHTVSGYARSEDQLTALKSEHPNIHTLCVYVHAIGSIIIKPAHLTNQTQWLDTLNLNLSSAFYALKEAVAIMQKQSSGSLIFYSSTAARIGIPNHEAIAASKAGIEALVRSAAATYSNRNVRFNCIAPGLTDTNLAKPITSNPQALEISKKMSPLNAIAQPDDIANLTAWLASDSAQFVTGQCFTVDGGLSATVPKPRA
jgi:NAD(P)-dependent dehydrogenase (short-subunit alcohol dehydrogenase family)